MSTTSGGRPASSEAPSRQKPKSPRMHRAKADTESPIDEEVDHTVSVYGDLHGGLTQVRASSLRLVLTFGEFSDGRDVLVPLVDWQTYGHEMTAGAEVHADDKGKRLSTQLLSFDNLAFLLQDLSYDTRDAVRLLVRQSQNGVTMVDERTKYAARMLRMASKHLQTSAELLDELLGDEQFEDE